MTPARSFLAKVTTHLFGTGGRQACARRRRLLTLALLVVPMTLAAQTQPIPVPSPPSLGAESYILMDHHSGRVLVEHNSDDQRDPASLTKLMTAYVVFSELRAGNIALDDMALVSERAWRAVGSRMFIEVGDRVRVEDLLRGMIIQSGNDASVALAEHVAGTEETFAQVMNQYAAQLGMHNTSYRNANGLPQENHYSTARDTAILAHSLIRDFPDFYGFYSERSFVWNDIEQFNRNRLLTRNPAVDGLKTGFTEAAGYCLASSAEQDGMRLISVIMGAATPAARVEQSQSLLSYGYRFFRTHRLYSAGETLSEQRVWKGAAETVPLGLERDLYVTIPERQYDALQATLDVDGRLTAPIASGSQVGSIEVALDGETITSVPLVTLGEVGDGSWWNKLLDEVLLWFD